MSGPLVRTDKFD